MAAKSKWRDWVKKEFQKMGLAKKFMIIIMVCLVLPLILVFSVTNSVVANRFLEKQYEKELEILKQSKPSLEALLEEVQNLSINVAASKEVQTVFNEYLGGKVVQEESLRDLIMYIEQQVYAKKYISSMAFYSGKTTLYQYGTYYETEDILEQEQKKEELEALQGKGMWDAARVHEYYTGGRENEPVVSLYRIVNHLYKITSAIGAERISISEEYLASLYGHMNEADKEWAYIFDDNGEIISSGNKEMLGREAPKEVMERTTKAEGYFINEKNTYAAFYYKLPMNGWTVVQICKMTSMKRQISMINVIFYLALSLSIFFGIIFSVWQKKTVINPIVKLARDVEEIKDGNYRISLYSNNSDEVGRLNKSIVHMAGRIQSLIETVYKGQIQCREAEILSLQSQINPHFLYNTLDTMRWIAVEHEENELAGQIEALSGMFRHVLNNGQEITTVEEEIKYLKNYLAIQKSRFGEKIQVDLHVDQTLYQYQVLKLILQPMVENAFVHGLEGKIGGGRIYISVSEEQEDILYEVRDNGVGTDEEKIIEILNSKNQTEKIYALKNVNDRIKLRYGKAYGVQFESRKGEGTVVRVKIAKRYKEENL